MAIISLASERLKREAPKPKPTIPLLMQQSNDIMARMKAKGLVVDAVGVDWEDEQDED